MGGWRGGEVEREGGGTGGGGMSLYGQCVLVAFLYLLHFRYQGSCVLRSIFVLRAFCT